MCPAVLQMRDRDAKSSAEGRAACRDRAGTCTQAGSLSSNKEEGAQKTRYVSEEARKQPSKRV